MATNLHEFWYRLRDFFVFSKKEKRDLIISIFVITLIFAYNDRSEAFSLAHWTINFILHFITIAIAMIAHVSVQKASALWQGIRAEYKMWPLGIAIGILVMLISKGRWYIILPGGAIFHMMVIQRLGHFRYGLPFLPAGLIAATGPLANLLLATFWETLALAGIFPDIFHRMTFVNLYYAFFSMMPLPNTDGIWLMFGSRLAYFFFWGVLVGYILLYMVGIFSLIGAIALGGVSWFLFYWFFEKKTKTGVLL